MVEALAEARDNEWRITARCAFGSREGMKRIRECKESIQLDLDTFIWTRGAAFPVLDARRTAEMSPLRIAARRLAVQYADQSDGEVSVSTNDGSAEMLRRMIVCD